MPTISEVLRKSWKQIAFVVIFSTVVAGVIVYLKPVQYLSVATAVPASSYASDKAAIFNQNIQALYGTLGNADDLDRVLGTAQLDTVYSAVAEKFNIWDHYKIKETSENYKYKAARQLQKNVSVIKSGYGELKVKVWDTDKQLAPQLANAIVDVLQHIHQDLQNASNEYTLKALKDAHAKQQKQADTARSTGQVVAADQYSPLIMQYQMMVDSKPPVLIVVEKAKPAVYANRPRRKLIIAATAVLSFMFIFLVSFIKERSKIVES